MTTFSESCEQREAKLKERFEPKQFDVLYAHHDIGAGPSIFIVQHFQEEKNCFDVEVIRVFPIGNSLQLSVDKQFSIHRYAQCLHNHAPNLKPINQ